MPILGTTPSGWFFLALCLQILYNVGMKNKEIRIRTDNEFIEKVDYLQQINDYKNRSDTIRKTVEKEYRKEQFPCGCCKCYEDKKCIILDADVSARTRDKRCPLGKEKEDDR